MSMKAVVELVLHIDSYYIMEYPHQGLFSFHCSVYQDKPDTRVQHIQYQTWAIPYQIMPNQNPLPPDNFSRTFVDPSLDDQKAVSSTALAKYSGTAMSKHRRTYSFGQLVLFQVVT